MYFKVKPMIWNAKINSNRFSPVTILGRDVELYQMQSLSEGSDSPAFFGNQLISLSHGPNWTTSFTRIIS